MSRDAYRFVLARPEHVPLLHAIERSAAALFPEADLPAPMREDATPLPELQAACAAGRLWVAEAASREVVGFALIEALDGAAHLREMAVHADHGRRGVGTALLQHVLRWARSRGEAAVTLTTFSHLAWNAPFYQRLGFRRLAPRELTPGLVRTLGEEASRGLDPKRRVAMRHDLRDGA